MVLAFKTTQVQKYVEYDHAQQKAQPLSIRSLGPLTTFGRLKSSVQKWGWVKERFHTHLEMMLLVSISHINGDYFMIL